tara:strand:- start:539 stop:712 length:174 start_codon:yes stop_codon:yes gene_type:complete
MKTVSKKRTNLTDRQKKTLARHKKHHTDKHMKEMIKSMLEGSTFGAAHKKAMRKVGK